MSSVLNMPAPAFDGCRPGRTKRPRATDADGIAEFSSIYPSYYVERAIHIHFKVHIGNRAFLTNQALLPETDNAAVLSMAPYNVPRKSPRVRNAQEGGWGLPTMKVAPRPQARLALLDVVLSV